MAQEELFGPVLVVLPHDGDDDAVRIANNSIFGLSGGVMSADHDRALGVGPSDPQRHDERQRRHATTRPTLRSAATSSPASAVRWALPAMDEFLERKTIAIPAV